MKQITYGENRQGPFRTVEVQEEGYLVNGDTLLPFTVVGEGVIEDWVGELPQPKPPAPEVSTFEQKLDAYFDAVAQSDRWDNRFTLMVRAGYPNRWQAKAIAFGTWVDACNEFAIELLEDVLAGEAEPPATPEAFLAMLPPPPDMTSEMLKGAHL